MTTNNTAPPAEGLPPNESVEDVSAQRQANCMICRSEMYYVNDPRHEQEYRIEVNNEHGLITSDYCHARCWLASRRTPEDANAADIVAAYRREFETSESFGADLACRVLGIAEQRIRERSSAPEDEGTEIFNRGVEAAKDAIRSELSVRSSEEAHYQAARFINTIARKVDVRRWKEAAPEDEVEKAREWEGGVLVAHHTGEGWALSVESAEGDLLGYLAWPQSWPETQSEDELVTKGFLIV